MTSRTRSPHAKPAQRQRASAGTVRQVSWLGWAELPTRVRIAFALSVTGAALTALGPGLGVVADAPARGFASMPLLVVLAALPPALAIGLAWSGRGVAAAGVLVGSALLAPGRALVDLQFARDALLVSRPELIVPTSLAPLSAAPGLWVLLGGHLAVAVAGLLAVGRAGAEPGSDYAEEVDDPAGQPAPSVWRRLLAAVAFAVGAIAVIGLLMAPFNSGNAFLLARDVIDSPVLVQVGLLLVGMGTFLGCVLAGSSPRRSVARGVQLGVLAAVTAATMPAIVAGFAVDRLSPGIGPYLTLIAVALLTLAVFLLPAERDVTPGAEQAVDDGGAVAEVRLPVSPLHLTAGILGVLAGVCALGGAFGDQLVVDAGFEQPVSYANRPLLPAGLLIVVLGGLLLVRRWSAAVRPAFIVALASIPLVGASTLDAALTGTGISDAVRAGAGVWFTAIAMIITPLAAGCAAVAGGAERDDVDLTERTTNLALIAPVAAAVLLAVGAFWLPTVRAPGLVSPGFWSDFRLASWGLLLAMVVVIMASLLAPLSRPARAASLLLGAAAVVGIRLLDLPLTGARTQESTAGPGTWLALACAGALIIAAIVAVVVRQPRRD